MPGPTQTSGKLRKAAAVSWIISAVSCVVLLIGIVFCARARTNSEQAYSILAIVLGGVFGLVAMLVAFLTQKQAKAAGSLEKGEGEIWARWKCSAEEVTRFQAAETERAKMTPALRLKIMLGAVALGILSPFLYKFVRHDSVSFGESVVIFVVLVGGAGLLLLLAPGFARREVKRAVARASGEILLSADGLMAGGVYYPWRSFNWGLRGARLEPGTPAVVHFDFLAGTIPGSAQLQVAGQLAYAFGASHVQGRTQQKQEIRVPVPHGKENEAGRIVATLTGAPAPELPALAQTETTPATVVDGPGIYVWKNNEQLGPFEKDELERRAGSGAFSGDDLVWRDGLEDWQPLRQFYPGLPQVVAATPPLPMPPPIPAQPPEIPLASSLTTPPDDPVVSLTKAIPPALKVPERQIYLWKNNEQTGPFEQHDVREQLTSGVLSGEDLGWREGMADWQPLRNIL
ncbi:MAG: hypothetical protein QOD64_70 [Verrucomicrobiota bacterium]